MGRFDIEQRGIERVPGDERTDTNGAISVGTMWFAANMVVPSFAIWALATPVFGLGLVDTILTIFINILGITPRLFHFDFWSALLVTPNGPIPILLWIL